MSYTVVRRAAMLIAALILIAGHPYYQDRLNEPVVSYDAPWVYPAQNPVVYEQLHKHLE